MYILLIDYEKGHDISDQETYGTFLYKDMCQHIKKNAKQS